MQQMQFLNIMLALNVRQLPRMNNVLKVIFGMITEIAVPFA